MTEPVPLVDAGQVGSYVGLAADDARVTISCELAESVVLGELGGLPDPVPAAVRAIALDLAARLAVRPPGVSTESAGSVARSYTGTDPARAVLTTSEKRALRKAAGQSSAFSIYTAYAPVQDGGTTT